MPELDLSSYRAALTSLQKALKRAKPVPHDDELRDACIQRFEYTYELAYKMLVRFLEAGSANPSEFDELTFRDVLRVGAEKGLIRDVQAWFDYRKARNKTSHAYDREDAEAVYAVIPKFAEDAEDVLARMEKKNSEL